MIKGLVCIALNGVYMKLLLAIVSLPIETYYIPSACGGINIVSVLKAYS